ncbi:hypothetical protein EJ04DRAFT_177264 [Polyplosphaeria fusca]|uniref:Uncharacterized protein n=1 Tax=Polyplosphaeria fusca TaxID=682080 RepID=A0A9P4R301_9PLEO|nr:hypothetical protein EJ04DRAFT_177264 [Polyplosphaeria fusca]
MGSWHRGDVVGDGRSSAYAGQTFVVIQMEMPGQMLVTRIEILPRRAYVAGESQLVAAEGAAWRVLAVTVSRQERWREEEAPDLTAIQAWSSSRTLENGRGIEPSPSAHRPLSSLIVVFPEQKYKYNRTRLATDGGASLWTVPLIAPHRTATTVIRRTHAHQAEHFFPSFVSRRRVRSVR